MTDRPEESRRSTGTRSSADAEAEPVDTATWPREQKADKSSDAGSPAADNSEKQSLAATAKAKLEAAKNAATKGERDRPATTAPASRGPRRARLRLTRIDPWSVMKTAFLLSIAFAVVTVVAVGMVWQVLGAAGVWDSINSTVQSGIGGDDVSSFQIQDYVGTSRVLGFTMLVAAIDVVLITAAATLSAFLYNMAAALLGGIEVTLSEDVD